MQEALFSGMDKEEREKFKQSLLGAKHVLDRIIKVLADRYDSVERKGLNEEDYTDSNWVFLQAFNNGRLAEIRRLADLINIKDNR